MKYSPYLWFILGCLTNTMSIAVPYGPYADSSPAELAHIEQYLSKQMKTSSLQAEEKAQLAFVYLAQNKIAEAEFLGLALQEAGRAEAWMPILGTIWYLQEDYAAILNHLVVEREDIQNALWAQEVLVLRAEALMGLGQNEEALAVLSAIKQINPRSGRLWEAMAKAHLRELAFDAAASDLKEAHRMGGRLADIALIQGDSYRLQGDMEAAKASYERSMRANPGHLEARIRLTALQMDPKQLDDFYQNTHLLYEQLPKNPQVQLFKAVQLMQKKALPEAEAILATLVQNRPDFDAARMMLARLYLTKGDYEEAGRLVQKLVDEPGDHPQARNLLAAIALKAGKSEQAIQLLSPYMSEYTEDIHLIHLLGVAYLLNENWDEGLQCLEKSNRLALLKPELRETTTTDSAAINIESVEGIGEVPRILAAIHRGDLGLAEQLAMDYLRVEGETALSHYLLGAVNQSKGNWDSAIHHYESAKRLDSHFLQAQHQLVDLYLKKGSEKEASESIGRILDKSPNNLRALLQKASLEEQRGELASALKILEQAALEHPKHSEPGQALAMLYLRLQQPDKALTVAKTLTKQFPNDVSVARLAGQLALDNGQDKEAEKIFSGLTEKLPGSPLMLHNLARAQKNLGKLNAAQDTLTEILSLDTNYLPALLLKGDVALLQEDFEEALSLGKRLVDSFPTSHIGYELLADAYNHQGQVREASNAYEKAFEYQQSAKLAKALYFSRLSEGKKEEALLPLEAWLEKNPEDTASARFLAGEYLVRGFPGKAALTYETVLRHASHDVLALNNLALLVLDRDPPRALELAAKARDLAPDRAKVLDTYGLALLKNGQQQEAFQVLKEAVSLAPEDPEIKKHYTQLYQ